MRLYTGDPGHGKRVVPYPLGKETADEGFSSSDAVFCVRPVWPRARSGHVF